LAPKFLTANASNRVLLLTSLLVKREDGVKIIY